MLPASVPFLLACLWAHGIHACVLSTNKGKISIEAGLAATMIGLHHRKHAVVVVHDDLL